MSDRESLSEINWRETWHEFVPGPYDRCALCRAKADRAVHSEQYAVEHGYEFHRADA